MRVIALEGINAAGKSSTAALLKGALNAAGHKCLVADPAGFSRIGRLLRKHLVHPQVVSNPEQDAILFTALRAEGARLILETVMSEPGMIVVLERWSLALAAYGAADGARPQLVSELRTVLHNTIPVDLTVLLDISGDQAYDRIKNGSYLNRFEARGPEYLSSVASWYGFFAGKEENTVVVDASKDQSTAFNQLLLAVRSKWSDLAGIGESS